MNFDDRCPICGPSNAFGETVPWRDVFCEGYLLGIVAERLSNLRGQKSHLYLCTKHLKYALEGLAVMRNHEDHTPDVIKALDIGLFPLEVA